MVEDGGPSSPVRWIVVVVAVVCLIAMLAYARGRRGEPGRDPGPEDSSAALVVPVSRVEV
jgi:hypothetical protein